MVTVFIWDPSTTSHGWGHAAVEVNGEFLSVGSTKSRTPTIPWLRFTHDKVYTSKMQFWNDHDTWPHSYAVHLHGLDELGMSKKIQDLRMSDVRYHTITENCATAVWKVLKAGLPPQGGDYALLWQHQAAILTPMALLGYAQGLSRSENR